MKILERRSAWVRALAVAIASGFVSLQVWPTDSSAERVVAALAAVVCLRSVYQALERFCFAAEMRSLRKRASVTLPPYNEMRLEILCQASTPNGAAIVEELDRCQAHLERNEARRHLRLLEAGIDLVRR